MALVTGVFQNCFNYTGDTIYKAFTIDNTNGWTVNKSYVIYSGDGACYAYISSPSLLIPVSTYLSPDATNVNGACNSSTGCPSVNTNMYPNNLFYTFSACCDGSTFSFRRGDIELSSDYVNGTTMWLNYGGTGGTFNGCATVITGYTGSTIYTDNNCAFSYSSTFSDCLDCETYYPCSTTPTPTKTPTPTPTTTPIICGSGITTTSSVYYTDCCGNFINSNLTIGTVVAFNYGQPYNGITKLNAPATTTCLTPTPTRTQTPTPTLTPLRN